MLLAGFFQAFTGCQEIGIMIMNLYECLGVLHLPLFHRFWLETGFMRLEVSLWRFLNKQPGWKAGGKREMRSRFLFFLIVIL